MKQEKKDRISEVYVLVFQTMQDFRKDNTKLFFGVSAVILAMLGWIITTDKSLSIEQRILITVSTLVIMVLYLILSISTRNHFLQAAKIVNKIDKIYGFYEKGEYLKNESLFPKEWENFGTKKWKEPMFKVSKIGVLVLSIFTIIATWIF